MNNESIAVEWSYLQNTYHRTPLSHALAANLRSLNNNRQPLFSIVAVVPTQEEASELIESLRRRTVNRKAPK